MQTVIFARESDGAPDNYVTYKVALWGGDWVLPAIVRRGPSVGKYRFSLKRLESDDTTPEIDYGEIGSFDGYAPADGWSLTIGSPATVTVDPEGAHLLTISITDDGASGLADGAFRLILGGRDEDVSDLATYPRDDFPQHLLITPEIQPIDQVGFSGLMTVDLMEQRRTVRTITTAQTLFASDEVVLVNAPGPGSLTVTLPTAVGIAGYEYNIKRINTPPGTVIIDADGTETIDGTLTQTLLMQWASVTIVSDGSNWLVI